VSESAGFSQSGEPIAHPRGPTTQQLLTGSQTARLRLAGVRRWHDVAWQFLHRSRPFAADANGLNQRNSQRLHYGFSVCEQLGLWNHVPILDFHPGELSEEWPRQAAV
jgi:hypothetical protein